MSEDTIIGFDDLEPGTVVDDQYASKGIEFLPSSSMGFDGGPPFVERLGEGLAHSGDRVLVIKNCRGEFCPSAVIGKFNQKRTRVQMFVGNLSDSSPPAEVTLFAYDANGTQMTLHSTPVPVGGVHTLLEVSRPQADIESFEVRATGFTSRLAIDDLRIETIDTTPAPWLSANSFDELMAHESAIVERIHATPNGGSLFLAHPFLLLADIGVSLSPEARGEIMNRIPELSALSPAPYRALRATTQPQSIRVNLRGLFAR